MAEIEPTVPYSQSRIRTKIAIPPLSLEKMIHERFPELGADLKMISCNYSTYSEAVIIELEHTIQKAVEYTSPIMLTMNANSMTPKGDE